MFGKIVNRLVIGASVCCLSFLMASARVKQLPSCMDLQQINAAQIWSRVHGTGEPDCSTALKYYQMNSFYDVYANGFYKVGPAVQTGTCMKNLIPEQPDTCTIP